MYLFIILQLILIWQSSYQKLKGHFFSIVSFDYDHAKTNTFGVFWNHRIKQRTFYSWMSEIKCILESNRWNAIANSITNENNNTWQICINFFNQREARKKNSKSPLRHLNVLDKELDKMYKICLRNVTLGTHEPLYNNVRFGLSISVWYSEIFSTEMWTSSAENAQTYHGRLWISSQACDSIVTTWVNSGFHTKKTYLNTKETKIPRHGKPEGSVSDVCALSQDIGQP